MSVCVLWTWMTKTRDATLQQHTVSFDDYNVDVGH